ncbi:MAG: DUF4190 domain-containing protein [Anaerolineae bacterium]
MTTSPATASTSPLALISLVAGVAAWTILPLLGTAVAIIAGHLAKREIAASGGRMTGDGLATVGLVLGYAHLIVSLLGLLIGLAVLALLVILLVFGLTAA